MKKQFILLIAFVLVCLLATTSAVVSSHRTCTLEQKDTQQQVPNDFVVPGPLNYFHL